MTETRQSVLVVAVRLGPKRTPAWTRTEGKRSYATFEHQGRKVEVVEVHGLRRWQLMTREDGPWSREALCAFAHAYGYGVGPPARRVVARGSQGGPRLRTWRSRRAAARRRQLILDRLEHQAYRSWELEAVLGLSRRGVKETLADLLREGEIFRDGHLYRRRMPRGLNLAETHTAERVSNEVDS